MPHRRQRLLVAISLSLCLLQAHAQSPADSATPASAQARHALQWVLERDDHGRRPFAIVDKRSARIHVYAASGSPLGSSPVLLGLTPGDQGLSAPLGGRDPQSLTPAERTTPAGRFETLPGRNLKGEAIVWLDYAAALAIHRLRPAPAHERREDRMRSSRPEDHRISLGCVFVPVAFYEQIVAPTLGRAPAVVYILPETHSAATPFRPGETAADTL
jgi:hypothetical protein